MSGLILSGQINNLRRINESVRDHLKHRNVIIGSVEEGDDNGIITRLGWLQYFDFFINRRVKCIVSDTSDNTYVGTSDNRIIKLDSLGTIVWDKSIHSNDVNDLACDDQGNVYSASDDGTVKKITPDGDVDWTFSGHSGAVRGVDVEGYHILTSGPTTSRNVYSCGSDGTVRKLNNSGAEQWRHEEHGANSVNDVVVDKGLPGGFDLCVYSVSHDNRLRKINEEKSGASVSGGVLQSAEEWAYELDGNGRGVAVDNNRRVYVADEGGKVHKVNPSGTEEWSFEAHMAWAVAVDMNSNVYAGAGGNGHTTGFNPASGHGAVHKLSSSGQELWKLLVARSGVDAVDISASGHLLMAGGRDGTARKINTELQIKGFRL